MSCEAFTQPPDLVKGPDALPAPAGWHVGEERAWVSSGVLPPPKGKVAQIIDG